MMHQQRLLRGHIAVLREVRLWHLLSTVAVLTKLWLHNSATLPEVSDARGVDTNLSAATFPKSLPLLDYDYSDYDNCHYRYNYHSSCWKQPTSGSLVISVVGGAIGGSEKVPIRTHCSSLNRRRNVGLSNSRTSDEDDWEDTVMSCLCASLPHLPSLLDENCLRSSLKHVKKTRTALSSTDLAWYGFMRSTAETCHCDFGT